MVEKLHFRCKPRNVNYTSSPLSSELIQSFSFPDAIPALTRVPQWAYLNPTGVRSVHSLPSLPTQSFLIEPPVRFLECFIGTKYRRCVFVPTNHIFYVLYYRALSVTDLPEVAGSASNVPSSTSNRSTITPGTSSRASSSSSSKSSSNAGAIAGGVIGGVIGVAVITGLVAWFTNRRRRRHAPSADYISGQGSDMGVAPYAMDVGRPKLYVSHYFFFALPREGVRGRD